jgi:hypothetical protein
MADVFAIFGLLLTLGIIFPGKLTAWWLLFPATVERAQVRLERTPWRCFWLGGLVTIILLIPITTLLALPSGLFKLAGVTLLLSALALAGLGAAGLVAKMGEQLQHRASGGLSPAAAFVRAAVALELAAAFPIIGWFVVIPVTIGTAVGATAFALLRWMPREPAPTSDDVAGDPISSVSLA